jgi:hypothetical protein
VKLVINAHIITGIIFLFSLNTCETDTTKEDLLNCWSLADTVYQNLSATPRNGQFLGDEYNKCVFSTLVKNIDSKAIFWELGKDTIPLIHEEKELLLNPDSWLYLNVLFSGTESIQTGENIRFLAYWKENSFYKQYTYFSLDFRKLASGKYSLIIRNKRERDGISEVQKYSTMGIFPVWMDSIPPNHYVNKEAKELYFNLLTKFSWEPNEYEILRDTSIYRSVFNILNTPLPQNWDKMNRSQKRPYIIDELQKFTPYVETIVTDKNIYFPSTYYIKMNVPNDSRNPTIIQASITNNQWMFLELILNGDSLKFLMKDEPNDFNNSDFYRLRWPLGDYLENGLLQLNDDSTGVY